ncbi:MAG: NAD(P)-dependent oxidoreductase [Planctomycetota bacterium]|jgi:adenosylhomocysteinase
MLPTTKQIIQNGLRGGVKPADCGLVIIQHLRHDTGCFLRILQECGFRIEKVIGIAYSSKQEVVVDLCQLGIDVALPSLSRLESEAEGILLRLASEGRRFILHEVGGYCASIVAKSSEAICKQCVGIIEDTKQGLWEYQTAKGVRVPVLHVAESALKDMEHNYVGQGVVEAIECQMSDIGRKLFGCSVGILGFGSIGSSVAKSLHSGETKVCCCDRDPVKIIQARACGIPTAKKLSLICGSNIIIGATGERSIEPEELRVLSDGVLLASASSKCVEFPVREIHEQSERRVRLSPSLVEFHMQWGKSILLSSEGFPINLSNQEYNLPSEVADLMFSQIAKCLVKLMSMKVSSGIQALSVEEEREIARLWLTINNK